MYRHSEYIVARICLFNALLSHLISDSRPRTRPLSAGLPQASLIDTYLVKIAFLHERFMFYTLEW
jgi:hypothetical protein